MGELFKVDDLIRYKDGGNFVYGAKTAKITSVHVEGGTDEGRYWLDSGLHIPFQHAHLLCERVSTHPISTVPSQAFKADAGKPQFDLLDDGCALAIDGVVKVLTFAVEPKERGGKGYVPHSWKQVQDGIRRYSAALARHRNAKARGERYDVESGLLHDFHIATNALFVAELEAQADQILKGDTNATSE